MHVWEWNKSNKKIQPFNTVLLYVTDKNYLDINFSQADEKVKVFFYIKAKKDFFHIAKIFKQSQAVFYKHIGATETLFGIRVFFIADPLPKAECKTV